MNLYAGIYAEAPECSINTSWGRFPSPGAPMSNKSTDHCVLVVLTRPGTVQCAVCSEQSTRVDVSTCRFGIESFT